MSLDEALYLVRVSLPYVVAIGVCIYLTGCKLSTDEMQPGRTVYTYTAQDIYTWHDDRRNVTCWLYAGDRKGGISCLPDGQVVNP